jgi:hypothetical protein
LLDDLCWEWLAPDYLLDHLHSLPRRQAAKRQVGTVGVYHPGWPELRTTEEEQEHTGRRNLVDEQAEPLQGRGIPPVEVVHDHAHGLPPRLVQQPGQQEFQGLLFLPLGCVGERGILRGRR